jgi:hypothetical protein
MRYPDQFISFPEKGCPGWAGVGARGLRSTRQPVKAKNAFPDAGIGLVPFVLGDSEWACDYAIPASDAFLFIVDNRPVLLFLQGADRAHGNAGRIETMHTEFSHI